ncbi:4Fe-4S binding domain-containing protein [Desulfotomaculum arcticum]|uniref:4Fe-4S binding domain-containing protein n=1 Tax=Desulfotruncus arcticus DSM 17038 TaxID=1121424 RepID=A0A1I2N9W8_9FIRM|nr:4Fe-4S binding protein [Desulfotruncus arcticus]SFG00343.1 4Fe-4S binding domain-containing protein [Desulfotomaculum arcticum] [Desulfotruncus arcticus DSM 17038]
MKPNNLAFRTNLQAFTWVGLPLVAIGGWFFPVMGFLLFGCMVGAVGLSFFRGRNWCDWMCPRGAFLDLALGRLSRNVQIPKFFKHEFVRAFMVMLIFTVIGIQFYFSWGNIEAMGMALVRVLTITTVVAILLGWGIHPRTWCRICPMGTVAHWIARSKNKLHASNKCVSCGLCAKACPMQLNPSAIGTGDSFDYSDCLKCSSCISSCPKKALSFESNDKEKSCRVAA